MFVQNKVAVRRELSMGGGKGSQYPNKYTFFGNETVHKRWILRSCV